MTKSELDLKLKVLERNEELIDANKAINRTTYSLSEFSKRFEDGSPEKTFLLDILNHYVSASTKITEIIGGTIALVADVHVHSGSN